MDNDTMNEVQDAVTAAFRQEWGRVVATLIGMTGHPEAVLARELALCYTTLALVTDLDAGLEEGDGVTQAEVFEVFARNMSRLRDLVGEIIESFPDEREDDLCAHALDGIKLPFDLP